MFVKICSNWEYWAFGIDETVVHFGLNQTDFYKYTSFNSQNRGKCAEIEERTDS